MDPTGSAATGRDTGVVPDRKTVSALFEILAPRYDRALQVYSVGQDLRWKSVLLRRLGPRPGERALDLACGTGLILDRLSAAVGPPNVVGADINATMLRELRRSGRGHPVVRANAERLPFQSGRFDLVTAGYLLKYVDLDRFSREVVRVLRPGGRFGGYDFSRPIRTQWSGRLYSVYLHRILPAVGQGVLPSDPSWRSVFQFLPRVAESSGWEDRVQASLERAGMVRVRTLPSWGGAITWVWAERPVHEAAVGAPARGSRSSGSPGES